MRLLLFMAVAAVATGLLAPATNAKSADSCTYGIINKKVGSSTLSFGCGPAHLKLTFGNKVLGYKILRYKGGTCLTTNGVWGVNFGLVTHDGTLSRPYDSLNLGVNKPKPGVNTGLGKVIIGFVRGGKTYLITKLTVKLNSGFSRASFSGKLNSVLGGTPYENLKATGSLNCNGNV